MYVSRHVQRQRSKHLFCSTKAENVAYANVDTEKHELIEVIKRTTGLNRNKTYTEWDTIQCSSGGTTIQVLGNLEDSNEGTWRRAACNRRMPVWSFDAIWRPMPSLHIIMPLADYLTMLIDQEDARVEILDTIEMVVIVLITKSWEDLKNMKESYCSEVWCIWKCDSNRSRTLTLLGPAEVKQLDSNVG